MYIHKYPIQEKMPLYKKFLYKAEVLWYKVIEQHYWTIHSMVKSLFLGKRIVCLNRCLKVSVKSTWIR